MKTILQKSNALVLGNGAFIGDLLREVEQSPRSPYRIIGVVAPRDQATGHGYGNQVLGDVGDLHRILDERRPEAIIVGFPYDRSCGTDQLLMEAKCGRKIRVEHADDVYERLTGKLPIETIAPQRVIYSDTFRPCALALMLNRWVSCVAALVGLVLFLPLMLMIAVLIKLDSSGPVFFVQKRCGEGGKSFRLFKFRTMSIAGAGRSEWEGDNKHRITRVGYWLRRFRLDELPQFLNVLIGDMNLVGPRPHPASSYALLMLVARNTPECGVQIPFYSLRCNVRPGITGWAQVRYRYANNINEEIEKLRFDLYYLKHYSFWLDLRIIAETAWVVVAGHRSRPNAGQLSDAAHAHPRLAISE
jgi:exopolysaccharide biosynthesis polyprenyl glycosylphosphotransferase